MIIFCCFPNIPTCDSFWSDGSHLVFHV